MALVWTVTNSTLSWGGCNYAIEILAESVLQFKANSPESGQISEFHIFATPNAYPCTVPPARGACTRRSLPAAAARAPTVTKSASDCL